MLKGFQYNNLSPSEAVVLQKKMRDKIDLSPLDKEIKLIGGADISFNKFEETVYAGIIVLSYPHLVPVSKITVTATATFPYISGLLAFREAPALAAAWDALELKPDILVLDGHGIAHQRRMGIATHFGILANIPTIGSAKSKLAGIYEDPENKKFAKTPLMHKGDHIGFALRTKLNCKPIFVSPGNKIGMEQSVEIIQNCVSRYRIPEPTRLAHNLVNEARVSAGKTLF